MERKSYLKPMQQTMRFLGMAAFATVGIMMTGCSGNVDFNPVIPQPEENNTQTITVSLNGSATHDLAEEVVKTFAEGDKIAVVYTNTSDETVKVESEALAAEDISSDGKNATFTVILTDAPQPNGDVSYIYPAVMAKEDGTVNYDALAVQDGTLATLASTLDVCQYEGSLTDEATLPTDISLDNLLAIGKFTIKCGSDDITSTVIELTVANGANTSILQSFNSSNTYIVTRLPAAEPIYVAMQPVDNGDINFTATDGTDDYEMTVSGTTLEASHLYPITLTMTKVELSMLACADENHPHIIDLGLPSGTKWACCNVGATTPEDYGGHYAWGETQPKDEYSWATYQCVSESSLVNISDIAGTGYDAATVNWGAPWRMPSMAQLKELVSECSYTWTTQNGVNGQVFTGPSGGSIFLPATGYRWMTRHVYATAVGYYWSSTLCKSKQDHAYYMYFQYRITTWRHFTRYYGKSVRPVR